MNYEIKRGEATIATVTPTGKQSKKIMGENIGTMILDLPEHVDLQINDYVDVFITDKIERYFLLDLADIKKSSSREFNYTITFKGWQYLLDNAAYLFPDADNHYTLIGQPLMGNLDTFIDLLIINANRDQTGWVKGDVEDTEYKLLTFNDNDTCLSVLASLASAYPGIEYWVDGQTVHMTKRGVVEDLTFQYGRGNGLYDITRNTVTDKKLVTRLYVYGSEKNLPADYKGFSNKLKLPGPIPFLEKNVWKNPLDHSQGYKYGVIERSITFDDIYPHRTGLVTAVTDELNFTDSGIDFNLNDQLLPGISAKITFNTGQLAGYVFEVQSYNNTGKTFKIITNESDKAFVVPTALIKPEIGDEYVITDINMPASYIEAAELELLAAGQAELDANCNPIVKYSVTCDPINVKQRGITLTLGNYVRVVDPDFGIDNYIRIVGFTRDLQIPSLYTMELAESVSISSVVSNAVASENQVKKITRIGKTTNQAYNNALQAKATADGVKLITDYWGVTIDPDHGIIASGTLLVGSGPVGNAGITGVIDNVDMTDPLNPIDKSVRIFVGADYDNKNTADFRVLDNGQMFASNAVISGKITASEGRIGNWEITEEGLKNESINDASIIQVKELAGGKTIEARIGTNIGQTWAGNLVAYFINDDDDGSINTAMYCRATGGSIANIAAEFDGDVIFDNGNSETGDHMAESTKIYMRNLPSTDTLAGFGTLVRENSSNKLFVYYT
jgi:hypothetical protein